MRVLVIRDGMISGVEFSDDVPTFRQIHDVIGNTFTTAFRIPGHASGLSIDGYCDDEFLLTNSIDWNVVLEEGTLRRERYPIGGPIVIIGGDDRAGESRDLVKDEIERFFIDDRMGMVINGVKIPTLRFKKW